MAIPPHIKSFRKQQNVTGRCESEYANHIRESLECTTEIEYIEIEIKIVEVLEGGANYRCVLQGFIDISEWGSEIVGRKWERRINHEK